MWPVVRVTIGGVTTDYRDTQQIITTGGRDSAACAYFGQFFEEGHDWVVVS